MRPRLEIHCDGVLVWSAIDPRTDDTETLGISIDGPVRYFPWPMSADGRIINPWVMASDFFVHDVLRFTEPKPPAEAPAPPEQPETWHDRPSML